MRSAAELRVQGLVGLVTENVSHAGANKCVTPCDVQGKYEIREAVHQAPCEFLLLIEAPLHFAALRDVHHCAVVTNDVPTGVAHYAGSVQADEYAAVFSRKADFAALHDWLSLALLPPLPPLFFIRQNVRKGASRQLILRVIAKHTNQRRIHVNQTLVRRNDVDAFLQGLKEFRKARFILAERGDVSREHRDAMDRLTAHHGMCYAIKVMDRVRDFKADLDDSGPHLAL